MTAEARKAIEAHGLGSRTLSDSPACRTKDLAHNHVYAPETQRCLFLALGNNAPTITDGRNN